MVGNVVLVGHRTEGRSHPLGVDNILHGERNTVKKAEQPPGHDLTLRIPRLGHGLIAAQRDEAVQLGLHSLGTRENGTRNFDRRNILANDPRAEFGRRQQAQFIAHRAKVPWVA